jgi:hypothetical protein
MEDFLIGSAKDNSTILLSAAVSIGIIKACDYLGRRVGNELRNRVPSNLARYLFYFAMVIAILVASKHYYAQTLPPNLFRKYGLTRFSTPEQIRDLYRTLARQSHPDMRGSRSDFAKMNTELKMLMNDRLRWFYDRFGKLSEGSVSDVQSEQIGSTVSTFIEYLSKAMFVVVFVQNDLNLNTRMSALGLVLVFLLFDIYNITARRPTSKDPLDFIYTDFTLQERSSILKSMFNIFFFFLISYKFAFEEPWVMTWMKWVSHVEVLQLALFRKTSGELQKEVLEQHKEIVRNKIEVIQSMDLSFNKKAGPPPQRQAPERPRPGEEPPQGETDNDLRQGHIYPTAPEPGAEAQIPVEQPQPQEQVNDPRDTSIWSMLLSLFKGIATFYAINMLIQYLANL